MGLAILGFCAVLAAVWEQETRNVWLKTNMLLNLMNIEQESLMCVHLKLKALTSYFSAESLFSL